MAENETPDMGAPAPSEQDVKRAERQAKNDERREARETARRAKEERRAAKVMEAGPKPLPRWYKATMFGLMIVGLLWICVFYLTQTAFPIPGIGGWNIIVGFGIAMVGFLMMSRWSEE